MLIGNNVSNYGPLIAQMFDYRAGEDLRKHVPCIWTPIDTSTRGKNPFATSLSCTNPSHLPHFPTYHNIKRKIETTDLVYRSQSHVKEYGSTLKSLSKPSYPRPVSSDSDLPSSSHIRPWLSALSRISDQESGERFFHSLRVQSCDHRPSLSCLNYL